ncbi:MAG: Na+/H+ antiporter NhaC family protein [Eubacteriales bacterium]|jgi:Na+/H+ antiporter NhaC|nr:Na+/H+ antiporter NhaC family protein [Eubacteriales bacterium]
MQSNKKRLSIITLTIVMICMMFTVFAFAESEAEGPALYATFWALVPPLIAIGLALITKEVYSSLFVGIAAGAFLVADGNPVGALNAALNDGFIASLSDSWDVGILMFLVLLGIIVALVNKAGGSRAYGDWARARIKTRKGSIFATFALGTMIFIDDYFNCLTVGSVMLPVTDRHQVSRAKLAYIVDATAAPICMIAPISSWAAAVSGVVEGYNGIELFIRAIPYNFYSLLTLVMIIVITAMNFDYGPMAVHERNAQENDDLFTTEARPYANAAVENISAKGKVVDLVLPVVFLIASCVVGMIYTGGFFDGETFINAFANCDASYGLPLGAIVTVLFMFLLYMPRKIISFKDFMSCVPAGFNAMVPAILILTFAWTLSSMTGMMGGAEYVAGLVEGSAAGLQVFLPAIIFLVAGGLAFSTGTSWGTFGILIPIVVNLSGSLTEEMLIIGISACLAGAVFGDHCSPISDTTIMSSTGAQCDHINHISTQLPYAATVAGVSFITYIVAGATQNVFLSLAFGVALMLAVLFVFKKLWGVTNA